MPGGTVYAASCAGTFLGSSAIVDCSSAYYSSDCQLTGSYKYNQGTSIAENAIKRRTFIYESLKWSEMVWIVENGAFPVLNALPYLPSVVIDVEVNTDSSAIEITVDIASGTGLTINSDGEISWIQGSLITPTIVQDESQSLDTIKYSASIDSGLSNFVQFVDSDERSVIGEPVSTNGIVCTSGESILLPTLEWKDGAAPEDLGEYLYMLQTLVDKRIVFSFVAVLE